MEAGSARLKLIGSASGAGSPSPVLVLPPVRSGASSNLIDYRKVDVRGVLSM